MASSRPCTATRPTPPRGHQRALIRAAQDGDELAFQRLLGHHRALLDVHTARYFLPGGDHDDVAQEARIAFAKAVRDYRPDAGASFGHFAHLCIARQLASAVTAARRHKHLTLSQATRGEAAEHALSDMAAGPEGPAERALAGERRAELRAAADTLSALERAVLAHVLTGSSSWQAAGELDITAKSADNALQRARAKIAGWYERQAA